MVQAQREELAVLVVGAAQLSAHLQPLEAEAVACLTQPPFAAVAEVHLALVVVAEVRRATEVQFASSVLALPAESILATALHPSLVIAALAGMPTRAAKQDALLRLEPRLHWSAAKLATKCQLQLKL